MVSSGKMLNAVDLYCGAGGTTTGAEMSGRVRVKLAVNHWTRAIETHSRNHPETRHICARLEQVDPRDYRRMGIDLILASPECTHHSIARGGRPVEDQKRSGGDEVIRWVRALRPGYLVVENVREWVQWGPVGKHGKPLKTQKGRFFRRWVKDLEELGYRVEWRLLNAADFGEATSRIRLFVIARRGRGGINWPEPTHRQDDWRGAQEIIDWRKPCPSIFERKRPLAENTLMRIEYGIKKFCDPDGSPFIVKLRGTGRAVSIRNPLPTITAGGKHEGLAVPFMLDVNHGSDGRRGNGVQSLDDPLGSITTKRGKALAVPFLVPNFGERPGQTPRTHSVTDPLPTVTSHGAGGLVVPFITKYYGTGIARPVTAPLDTITTKKRFGLAMVSLIETMGKYRVADVGFRMLENDELLVAQGFPPTYHLHGNIGEQTKQIGNSVCPGVARAICLALAG